MLVVLAGSSSPTSPTPAIAAVSHLGFWLGHFDIHGHSLHKDKIMPRIRSKIQYTRDSAFHHALADCSQLDSLHPTGYNSRIGNRRPCLAQTTGISERSITITRPQTQTSLALHPKEPRKHIQARHTEGLGPHLLHSHKASDTFLRTYYHIPQVELLHVFQRSTLRCL